MITNPHLSIVIPTYNRADFLDYSLEVHIPLLEKHNIQIFVSDNASTDATEQVMAKWMDKYPLLHYSRNETNIGPDANFEKALKLPVTNYIWLLSDTYQLPKDGIDYLLNTINDTEKYFDVIVFNLANISKLPTKNYQDQNELLSDLGAVMTCAAISVYNKKLIDNADFQRYYNSYFIQTGIIFEAIAKGNFLIHWAGEYSVGGLEKITLKKRNWSHTAKAFEIGCENWMNFVMSLPPSYTLENKMKCIMDFGKVSGLFTFKNLIMLRIANLLNYEVFNKYKKFFSMTINYPLYLIFAIAVIPKVVFKIFAVSVILVFKRDKIEKISEIWNR